MAARKKIDSEGRETRVPKYDDYSYTKLKACAHEFGVKNTEAYSRDRLIRVCKAYQSRDYETAQKVADEVAAIQKRNDEIARSVERRAQEAAKNVHSPAPDEPSPLDKNLEAKALVEAALRNSEENPGKPLEETGPELVKAMLERAKMIATPDKRPKRVESSMDKAIRLAGGGIPQKTNLTKYEITKGGVFYTPHGSFRVPEGAHVDSRSHNLDEMRNQGFEMKQIPHAQKPIFNELGQLVGSEAVE